MVSLDDTGSDSVKENYFTAGQVVNMYTIANQLATGRSHYSAKCITNSSKSSGGDGVGSTDNGESHSPPPVLMLHILELNVQIGEREGIDAVPAYCELRCKASSSQGEKHIRSHTFMLTVRRKYLLL